MNVESFRVDLRGVVDILSHHLYSSPRVYLRELIQNARDAVVARRALDAGTPEQITIHVDDVAGSVSVHDHGIGLTEDEMRTVLATIGASSKRGDFLNARRDFLGQFGIGLLSCFLIADRIEVRSRSARTPDAPTLTWVGSADGTFTVGASEVALEAPGTEVTVRARPDDAEWVSAQRVRMLVDTFAALLELPVTLVDSPHGAGVLLSQEIPPWRDADEAALWCARHLGFTPLTAFPIAVPAAGVVGVAFLDQNPGRVGSRRGDTVYSRGMFVAADNTQLAPDWAYFAHLAVEAGDLPLTASRESLQDSGAVASVKEQIGEQLRAGIERFAEHDPDGFAQFMRVHDKGLLAMAVSDPLMLDLVVRHLLWETSEGWMSLDTIRRRWDSVRYTTSDQEFTAFAPILRAHRTVLINGSYVYGREILGLVGEGRRFSASPKPFDADEFLTSLDVPAADDVVARQLTQYVAPVVDSLGLSLVLRTFQPADISVLIVGDTMAEPAADDDAADDPWAELLGSNGDQKDAGPQLVLNTASSAVRALVTIADPQVRDEAVRGLYVVGLLNAGEKLLDRHHALLHRTLHTLIAAAGASESTR